MEKLGPRLGLTLGLIFLVICVEAFMYGYTYPLFSLVLSERGLPSWLIGLNAGLATLGILFVGPIIPRLISRYGLRNLTLKLLLGSIFSFFGIVALYKSVYVWFLSRFVMGICFLSLWITTEVWLNSVAPGRVRVKVLGLSGALYAMFQFAGPCLLSYQVVASVYPLYTSIAVLGVGAVAAMLATQAPLIKSDIEAVKHIDEGILQTLRHTGILLFVAFLTGIAETAMQSLLPVYAFGSGYSTSESTEFVAAFSLGEAVLAGLLGYAAGRYGRLGVFITSILLAITVLALMPVAINHGIYAIAPLLFIGGGVTSGLYTLGVVIIGQEYQGRRLATISSGFIMGYSAGGTIGPIPVGYLMDIFSPQALPLSLMASFLPLLWLLTRPYRGWSSKDHDFYNCLRK